ncbi:MAG: DUF368 domain-containing protein [Planctomycetales bacterium]|nr:DUF368 domain-containing protein [Planctomycetales bacterium]
MPQKPSLAQDLGNVLRGFLMGAADIVPGVSGGTVALILGIYQRLVTAVSRVDSTLLTRVIARQWRSAAEYLDLRFLIALGLGIGIGIVGLAHLMHELLTHYREQTYAAFFGLILASSLFVGRMCLPRTRGMAWLCVLLGAAGVGAAWWVVTLDTVEARHGLVYTFASGCIGICAMILPGVSGSYLLLLLDMYEEITGIIKEIPKLQATASDWLTLAVFASGCLIGILLFSKALKWLLMRFEPQTMAVLCGFMIGSLWKVWPFQHGTSGGDLSLKEQAVQLQPCWPTTLGAHELGCLAIAAAAFAVVLLLDGLGRRYASRVSG